MTDAKRLLGEGVPLVLADGEKRQVRFTFRSLAMLEEEFGSVGAALASIGGDATKPQYGPIARVLAAALADDGLSKDDVLGLLVPSDAAQYVVAISEAFDQAFPDTTGSAANPPKGETTSSPGTTGTTSPPSPSAEGQASSG